MKMFKQLIIVVLTLLVALQTGQCSIVKDINERDSSLFEEDVRSCTQEGLMCMSCSQVALCILDENDQFIQLPTEACNTQNRETCLNATCTAEPNPFCEVSTNVTFVCTSQGTFPDPFDCKKYHICCHGNEDSGTEVDCDQNHAFDPLSQYCKTPLTNQTCTGLPVPKCTKVGQLGALTINKSIYYICQLKPAADGTNVLYPVQHLCPNGKSFINNHCT